jgi:hypothetical protein
MDLSTALVKLSAGKLISTSDLLKARNEANDVINAIQGKGAMFICTLRHLQNEIHTIEYILTQRGEIN